jgi:NAD(P)-dependent dehydrogenase (short-subunit alcohol dehydrogenase family)
MSSAAVAAPARLLRRFAGRSVVVTGSGSAGIGAAIVEAFVREGARVAALDLRFAAAAAASGAVTQIACDVSSEKEVEAAFARVGDCDVLVNNAAAFLFKDVVETTDADWRRTLDVNVIGYANTMRAAVRGMRARGRGGAIVNVSSMSGLICQERFVPYSTSKAAQLHMTRLVALDEGRHGIRVNAVAPGPILTDGTRKHAADLGEPLEKVCADMVSNLAIKRMGRPEEVANAVLFLASDEASFTTGGVLNVDAGYTLS